ncbi:MAG: anthranilate synthase component I family protein [Synergistaceae bacterium]|nr:anthranilate synthase component I family protein [Synergistaceae bacterium]
MSGDKGNGKKHLTSLEDFTEQGRTFERVPIFLELPLERRAPLDLYRRLRTPGTRSFLLESGDGGKGGGRYSFIGIDPDRVFQVSPEACLETDPSGKIIASYPSPGGLRKALEGYLSGTRPPQPEGFPPFLGGVAGYFAYDMVETWEDLFHGQEDRSLAPSPFPRAVLMGFETVVAMDHFEDRLFLVHNVRTPPGQQESEKKDLYRKGCRMLEKLEQRLNGVLDGQETEEGRFFLAEAHSNMEKTAFLEMVRRGREHIVAGDVCQVVLSQCFSARTNLPSVAIYETLAECNPSPYLFLLELPELRLIGSSPEVLVRLRGSRVVTRPLAGTRRRGQTHDEDRLLARELLADEKERAEHLMLVDLARNDLGRVCRTGSVEVTELMGVESYSHVMHIVSQVEGDRRAELTPLDVLQAAFPAGTVSGAPKIRAMEIIEELEGNARGPYAGAVGYIGFDGNMDTCITIRTLVQEGDTVHVQAGAGIVYDSVPEREYEETQNKARALFKALETAIERGNAQ